MYIQVLLNCMSSIMGRVSRLASPPLTLSVLGGGGPKVTQFGGPDWADFIFHFWIKLYGNFEKFWKKIFIQIHLTQNRLLFDLQNLLFWKIKAWIFNVLSKWIVCPPNFSEKRLRPLFFSRKNLLDPFFRKMSPLPKFFRKSSPPVDGAGPATP